MYDHSDHSIKAAVNIETVKTLGVKFAAQILI